MRTLLLRPFTLSVVSLVAAFLVIGGSPVGAAVPSDRSALEPASAGGLAALDRALVRLANHQRLLVIAAHPDDEDTALLTWVARGIGGEAAYLSLSRGDGGQNLIGPELGIGLGLLRSRELQSARRIDGARQFFSRAYDFGYTRSLEETLERWPKEILLEDTMRVIRRFKPQVLVSVFPPTAAAGHGQHQAAGLVAEEIFELSASPDAFPQLDAEGLPPWKISSFYRGAWWDPEAANVELPLGTLEPFTGRSILQLALASRSQHRCQDMGSLQPLGDASGRLTWVAGAGQPGAGQPGAGQPSAGVSDSPFAGVDTRLAAIADLLGDAALRRQVASRLDRVAEVAVGARRGLSAGPQSAVEPLLEIVRSLRDLDQEFAAAEATVEGAGQARGLIAEKLQIATEGLANAAQIVADAATDRQSVVPGERFEVKSMFWNAGGLPIADLEVTVQSPQGWRAYSRRPPEPSRSRFATQLTDEQLIEIEVPADARPTTPYFLERPLQGDLFDWSETAPAIRGEPFEPPPLSLRFAFTFGGEPLVIEREVVYRVRDQAFGEVRRPLEAVPALEVSVEPELVVWPIGDRRTGTLEIEIASNVDRPVQARLEVTAPAGWRPIEPIDVNIEPATRRRVVEVQLEAEAADSVTPGHHTVDVQVHHEGRTYQQAASRVDYEHVRPTTRLRPATVRIAAGDIHLPQLERLGYLRGASDRVPEALLRIGLPVELLSAAELTAEALELFDAIVIGSRAYEVDPALLRVNALLLDYARAGGLLIVQYQQYQFTRGGFAPFPLEIRRPHDRVTDETAAVRYLEPEHPVFTTPNALGDADWLGWVQERGLYMAGTWDDAYRPLLAMADPGGEEKHGSLLIARLGQGHYVYTGLAFFRQLPAGVTGAYRLFANLLALGADEQPGESS